MLDNQGHIPYTLGADGVCREISTGKPILSIDYDGVLVPSQLGLVWDHSRPNSFEAGPAPGALEFVTEAVKHFYVVIHSSRCNTPEGEAAIRAWLNKYGFPNVQTSRIKPPFHVHIDDRGYHFNGKFPTIVELMEFRPHWAKTSS